MGSPYDVPDHTPHIHLVHPAPGPGPGPKARPKRLATREIHTRGPSLPFPEITKKSRWVHRAEAQKYIYLAMPVISPRADWFPPDLQIPTTTTPGTDYVVFFLRHTWNGLALFAVFVIARHTVRRVSARWRRDDDATNTDAPSATVADSHWQHPPFRDSIPYPQGKQGVSPRRSSEPYRSRHYYFPSAPLPPWMMAGGSGAAEGGLPQQGHQTPAVDGEQARSAPGQSRGTGPGEAPLPRYIMARPPPASPLTPPPPSQVFTPEHGALGATLIHQPNPDYLSPTASRPTTSSDPTLPQSETTPLTIPAPHSRSSSEAHSSPRSFPSPTPFLPPAPPTLDGSGKSVDVQGEVVSVTDGFGTGWTRHTRVYGGGVCLACAASGEGFYGATALRPEGS